MVTVDQEFNLLDTDVRGRLAAAAEADDDEAFFGDDSGCFIGTLGNSL